MSILYGVLNGTRFAFHVLFLNMARFVRLDDYSRKKIVCILYLYRTAGKHLQTPSNELKNNSPFLMTPLKVIAHNKDHNFFHNFFTSHTTYNVVTCKRNFIRALYQL